LLRQSNLVRGHFAGIKIVGEGELKHGLKVQADKISTTAREKIEKAGGTIIARQPADGQAPNETPAANAKERSTGKPAARAKSPKTKRSRKS
jgi:large subunit ribosomal protein L15